MENDQPQIVRTAEDLQWAHDILVAVICDADVRQAVLGGDPESERSIQRMTAAADVLCWALGHDHNANFEQNLRGITETLVREGYGLHNFGRLVPGPGAPEEG